MMLPLAHAGHWLANLAYAAPVIALVAVVLGVTIGREWWAGAGPTEHGEAPGRGTGAHVQRWRHRFTEPKPDRASIRPRDS